MLTKRIKQVLKRTFGFIPDDKDDFEYAISKLQELDTSEYSKRKIKNALLYTMEVYLDESEFKYAKEKLKRI